MGVNMAGNCIIDDEVCQEASRQEIIRRYYKSMDAFVSGSGTENEVRKIELLLQQAHADLHDRKVVPAAWQKKNLPVPLPLQWNFLTERSYAEKLPTFSVHLQLFSSMH